MNQWPTAAEVEQCLREIKWYDGPQGQFAVRYLRQFAVFLRQMEQPQQAVEEYFEKVGALAAQVAMLHTERDHWKLLYEGKSQHD